MDHYPDNHDPWNRRRKRGGASFKAVAGCRATEAGGRRPGPGGRAQQTGGMAKEAGGRTQP